MTRIPIRLSAPRKFRNRKTVVDNITFDSAKEAKRYQELKLLALAGKIRFGGRQTRFRLEVNGHLICTYVADFQYFDLEKQEVIVEDVKSTATKTAAYRIKKRLMLAIHGIEIKET